MTSTLTHLECSNCGATLPADRPATTCPDCGKVLFARYDLAAAARTMTPGAIRERPWDMWRYGEILRVLDPANRVSLGEGATPLLATPASAARWG
jgi:threonine synthase